MTGAYEQERERGRKVATIALHRAMEGDIRTAAHYISRLNGSPALQVAIMGWIDTYIARCIGNEHRGTPLPMAWTPVETGGVRTADEVPPPARWAGRLISARLTDDEDGYNALLRAPAEGVELGDGIIALLQMVAIGLKRSEAGMPALIDLRGGAA